MLLGATLAEEDSERDREVGGLVGLAVDAELIERVLPEVALDLCRHAFWLRH